MKRKLEPGWHWFCVDFNHGGSEWIFYIAAQSIEDAETRLTSIRENGRIGGRIVGEYDADTTKDSKP